MMTSEVLIKEKYFRIKKFDKTKFWVSVKLKKKERI